LCIQTRMGKRRPQVHETIPEPEKPEPEKDHMQDQQPPPAPPLLLPHVESEATQQNMAQSEVQESQSEAANAGSFAPSHLSVPASSISSTDDGLPPPPPMSSQESLSSLHAQSGALANTFGVVPSSPAVEGDTIWASATEQISVTKESRILVKNAGRADVNGYYVARTFKVQGRNDEQVKFVKEQGVQYVLLWVKKKRDKPAVYTISWDTHRLYQGRSRSAWALPTRWEVARSSYFPDLEPAPEIADMTSFRHLIAEHGCARACMLEAVSFWHEEMRSDGFMRRDANSSMQVGQGKVYSSDDFEDDEVYEVGNQVIISQDKDFVEAAFKDAGLAWNDRTESMVKSMLAQSNRVVEVVSDKVIVLTAPDGERMQFPDVAVDLDYSNIAQFYTHHPIFIGTQTFTCVLLWLWFAFRDAGRNGASWAEMMGGVETIWPGRTSLLLSMDCEDFRGQIWRWFSYQFTHVGLAHIGTNAVMNLLLGVGLEKFHGSLKMALMYELGVFGGACCYLVADAHTGVVGTSGGCFALIGIRMGDLLMNWSERPKRWIRLCFLVSLIIINIIAEAASSPEGGVSTSNAAHFGGGVAGLLAGVAFGRNLKRERWEVGLQIAVVILGIALVIFCMGTGLQWPPRNIFEDDPWCWMRQVSNGTVFGTWDWRCVRCHSSGCIEQWMAQQRVWNVTQALCDSYGGFSFSEG